MGSCEYENQRISMKKSTDIKVQDFIEKIELLDPAKHLILQTLREIVLENYPKTQERMMYGGILFSLDDDFGGVFVYKNHVSFEFSLGYKLNDPEKLLEGKGKFRRHLKVKSLDEIEMKKVDFFVKQIEMLDK